MDMTYVNCCPDLWRELHLRGLSIPIRSQNNREIITREIAFINAWMTKIPVKGCKCADFWHNWYRSNPINFTDYFAWTVSAHNAVNNKLHRPLWTVEHARNYWLTQQ